jgi:hypothetical protein
MGGVGVAHDRKGKREGGREGRTVLTQSAEHSRAEQSTGSRQTTTRARQGRRTSERASQGHTPVCPSCVCGGVLWPVLVLCCPLLPAVTPPET